MRATKKRKLEAHGWRVGTARELLGLSSEEEALIEIRLALGGALRARRTRSKWSQVELAEHVGSSQSRVAKMEAGDPTVSLDLLIRSLLALGAKSKDVAKAMGASAA
jgi:ribosome-binding protein aMBF1 (putative translation factor)